MDVAFWRAATDAAKGFQMKGQTGEHCRVSRRRLVQSIGIAPLFGLFDLPAASAEALAAGAAEKNADLAAAWRIALDPTDEGIAKLWPTSPLSATMALPGSLEQNRNGHPVSTQTPFTGDINDRSWFTAPEYLRYREGNDVKVPFILQPDTWYRGAVWFQRDIEIPADWSGKRIELFLERPHWETQVWIDGRALGRCDALHLPHIYDLGTLKPGQHRLAIRVDNRMIVEIGHNGHGVTDHTQGNWNGIAGRIELRAIERAWIDQIDLYPDFASRKLTIRGKLGRLKEARPPRTVDITVFGKTVRQAVTWSNAPKSALHGEFEVVVSPDAADAASRAAWDEFNPVLHNVAVKLGNGAQWAGHFGWRELVATPKGFLINGRPAMFRGALECAIFPLTGHPPTDIESWRHVMRRAKDYGLNHLRFHSYCPPEAAFDAADEAGIYIQIETVWANQSAKIGSGLPVDQWVYAETDRILAAYGNRPSFMLMTHGNEPGGGGTPEGEAKRDEFLGAYVRHYRAKDPRRLWTSGSGWPTIGSNQYHVTPTPRIQNWGEELKSRINAKPPETLTDYRDFIGQYPVPVISHEIGQWCVYPNLAERAKYTGYLKAKNFDIFADRLEDSGLLDRAPEFLQASGRLQVLCYKEDIESALRTHGMGGFQLLGLQDFPGQGTALVGVVDPFWDEKPYISAEEYRRFCAPTVPLARLASRVVRSGDPFPLTIDVAHFGAAAITDARIEWRIEAGDGAVMVRGAFAPMTLPLGNAPLGLSASPVLTTERATAARLVVTIIDAGGQIAQNDWDLWVYPAAKAPAQPAKRTKADNLVRRTDRIDAPLLEYVANGGTALIGLPPERIAKHETNPVKLGFSSIFWNTLWTQRQAPTTLGILCDPHHPALAAFPSDAHSNWQWWYLIHRAGALRMDVLPKGVEPIVRVIDDWFTARSLALMVEVKLGKGKAIVCGFSLDGAAAEDPVSRQLISSLENYMHSPSFNPATAVSAAQLAKLMSA